MHKLRRDDASPREYYAEASRVVRLKAALASRSRGIDPNSVDAETAAETFKLDTDSRDGFAVYSSKTTSGNTAERTTAREASRRKTGAMCWS